MRNDTLSIQSSTYNILLRAWSRSVLPTAASKCWEILLRLEAEGLDVNEETFALVGYALSKSRNRSAENVERVEDLYRRLCFRIRENRTTSNLTHLQSMHRSLVNIWSLSRTAESLHKTISLLEAMCMYNLEPHPSTYSIVSGAWGIECLQASRTLLNKLIDKGVRGQRLRVPYNLLLASSRRSVDVSSAEELFASMSAELYPDIVSYNLLLEAIGRSNSKDVVKRSMNILKKMKVSPNDYTFTVMTKLWTTRLSPQRAMEEADTLFQRIPNPSLASYCSLISGWSRLDSQRAAFYVDTMMKNWQTLSLTEVTLYASLIDAVARHRKANLADKLLRSMMSAYPALRPDVQLVTIVLNSWAQSGAKNCGSKAHDLLDEAISMGAALNSEMTGAVLLAWLKEGNSISLGRAESLFRKANREKVSMNFLVLKSMLLIYGRMRDVAERAEELLHRILREYPTEVDVVCFNIVLEAWGRSSWRVAGQRAEKLFDLLLESKADPDVISYTSLMSALGKDHHEESIHKVEKYFKEMSLRGIEPDSRAYNTLISILTKSKLRDKEERVRMMFDEMIKKGKVPSIVTYTAMLSMYGSSKDPEAGVFIYEIFERIKNEELKLDAAGYSSLLSAIGRTSDENAALKADSIFAEMIAEGIKPDSTAWNIIISIWARSKLPQKYMIVENLFHNMLEMECLPNEFIVATLFKLWTFCRDRDYARTKIIDLYDYLLSSKVVMDTYAMKAMLQALQRLMSTTAALEKADQLLGHMLDFGIIPQTGCFTTCIKADSSPKAYVRGMRYFLMLRNAGVTPPKEIYKSIMHSIERPTTRKTDETIRIYRRLQKELSQDNFKGSRLDA